MMKDAMKKILASPVTLPLLDNAANLLEEAQNKIKELEQQLAEQVAYGEYLCTRIPRGKTFESNPSQDLVNQMKAEAVREAVEVCQSRYDEDSWCNITCYADELGGSK